MKIKIIHYSLFTISLLLLTVICSAQDTINVEEIHINADKSEFHRSLSSTKFDSSLVKSSSHSSIAEVLSVSSGFNLKSYGKSGGLSIGSIRGTGANHLLVCWESFPLNSTTTGDFDLSIVPVFFFSGSELNPSSSSTAFGSGSAGGVISLKSSSVGNKKMKLLFSSEIGSFGAISFRGGGAFYGKKLSSETSFIQSKSDNNFPFENIYKNDNPIETRSNNALFYRSFMQTFGYKISSKFKSKISFWWFEKEKQIPEPASSFSDGSKLQYDKSLKIPISLSYKNKRTFIKFSSALFNDFLHYTDKNLPADTSFSIDSKFNVIKLFSDLTYRQNFKRNFIIESSARINRQHAEVSNYSSEKNETNASLSISLKQNLKTIAWKADLRAESTDNLKAVLLYSLQFMHKFNEKLKWQFKHSSHFRRPTFNEKFWYPGGNINLKPESGFANEFSLKHIAINKNQIKLTQKLTAYYMNIENMIQWLPDGGIWKPVNNENLFSTGLEYFLTSKYNVSRFNISYTLSYALNFASYKREDIFNEHQLMYKPRHLLNNVLSLSYNNFSVLVYNHYTGKRYSSDVNSTLNLLPEYQIWNINFGYRFHKYLDFTINLKAENVFNKYYESVRSYPQPGRVFYISVSFGVEK